MTLRRSTAAAALVACTAAVAGPALAADGPNPVTVSMAVGAGDRQFEVEDTSGSKLSAMSIDPVSKKQPFRTRVTDTFIVPTTGQYDVEASMSNLYLVQGGTPTKSFQIPSSKLSLSYATTPLSAGALTALVQPKLSVGGALKSCADPALKTALGLDGLLTVGGLVSGITDTALAAACTTLGTAGTTVPVAQVDGVARSITTTIADVAKLPTTLSGNQSGAFTHADYSTDPTAKTDADTDGKDATRLKVMSGRPASGTLDALLAPLDAALAGVPLVKADGTGAAPLDAVRDVVGGTLETQLAALTTAQQTAILSTLPAYDVLAPVLDAVKTVSGNYYSHPVLEAQFDAPVPGTYRGTMVVTFTQS